MLRTAGVMVTGAVAGCTRGAGTSSDGEDNSDGSGKAAETTTATPSGDNEDRPSVAEFLSDTSNFDKIYDRTGRDSVRVQVGTEGNTALYAFAPPAIRVSTGTTVTWAWTGRGGNHNVVAQHGATFESKLMTEEGATFEHTFDEVGTVLYVCEPHKSAGMKGAVVVEE